MQEGVNFYFKNKTKCTQKRAVAIGTVAVATSCESKGQL